MVPNIHRNHVWSFKKSQERFWSFGKLNSTLTRNQPLSSVDKHEDSTAQCSGTTMTNTGCHSVQCSCFVAPVDFHFTSNRCMHYLCIAYYLWYHWLLTYPNIRVHISWLESTSADLRQQHLTSFCAVCGVLFYYKRESTVVSSGVRDVTLVTHICSHLAECLYATFCNQTWYFGAPPWARMSCGILARMSFGILSSRSRSQCGLI